MTKTLYFEGAGWPEAAHNGVGNCRARTAFRTSSGKEIFVEIQGREITKYDSPEIRKSKTFLGYVSSAFYITDDSDDENKHRFATVNKDLFWRFEYTKENILKAINALGGDFDRIEVINDPGLYSVFAGDKSYNLANDLKLD